MHHCPKTNHWSTLLSYLKDGKGRLWQCLYTTSNAVKAFDFCQNSCPFDAYQRKDRVWRKVTSILSKVALICISSNLYCLTLASKCFWLRRKGCSLLTNGWYCRIFYPKGSVYFSWEILHELAKVSVFWEKVRYKWSKPVVNLKGPGTVAQLSGFCTLALHSSLGMGILFKKKPFFRHFGTQKSQLAFSGSKWFLGISWNVNFSQ